MPKPFVVPHENLAVAMAHGAYLMTGRPQAVMVHVNVGTANTINNVINLARDRVPLILAAGRTPFTEKGKFGSRNRYIHWAQEMFDQAAMLREAVKWDYELRMPEQAADVVARAYEVTMTSPRGPVYLVLPREPLAAPLPEPPGPVKPRSVPAAPHPDPRAIATLAEWIAAAEKPLIITSADRRDARSRRSAALPSAMPFRWSRSTSARCACRPATRCTWATTPACSCRTPISSSSSKPTCRGSRTSRRRSRTAASRRSAKTRPIALSDAQLPERPRDHRHRHERA